MRYLSLLCVLMLISMQVVAQEDDLAALLPVIEAEDVFVNGVNVVETLPMLITDEADLYFLGAEADKWESLFLPVEMPDYIYLEVNRLRNGGFRVFGDYDLLGGGYNLCHSFPFIFDFNVSTHEFNESDFEQLINESWTGWLVFYSSPPEKFRLRNFCATELFSTEMPQDIHALIEAAEYRVYVIMHMPKYTLIGAATLRTDNPDSYTFAIYTIANDSWSETFSLNLHGNRFFRETYRDDSMLYFSASGEDGTVYYKLDIVSQTFHELFRTPYSQYVPSKPRSYIYYYIDYDAVNYQIYRYDLLKEESEIIFEIPCTELTADCTEVKFAGDNLLSDMDELMFVVKAPETNEEVPHFVINVNTSEVLHKAIFSSSYIGKQWLEEEPQRLLMSHDGDNTLVDLESGGSLQVELNYRIGTVSPNEQYVITYSRDENEYLQVGVVNLGTSSYRQITQPLDTIQYDARVYWREDSTLHVEIISHDEELKSQFSFLPIPLRAWAVEVE